MGDKTVEQADTWAAPDFRVEGAMDELGTLTMSVKGELDLSTAGRLLDELGEWLGISACTVDLSECEFIDSSGIRALLECRHQIGPDAPFRVVGLTPRIGRVLQRAGLGQIATLEAAAPDGIPEQPAD